MTKISAADVSKLRKITGAGMMDCKKALTEAEGDFERAKELIREKGLAIANKRADREATEGAVLAKASDDKKTGVIVCLNCETDFVAKNEDFVALANSITEIALEKLPENLEALKAVEMNGLTLEALTIERSGVTGEKIEISYYEKVNAEYISTYIHMGNKLATIVGFSKEVDEKTGLDIAMQITAMNPVAIDEKSVPQTVVEQELKIGREQARNEGKPEELVEKIAMGKLQKFYKESTLLNQDFVVSEDKMSVKQYLQSKDKELTITDFKRYGLSN
jgi:elongation factor Ts